VIVVLAEVKGGAAFLDALAIRAFSPMRCSAKRWAIRVAACTPDDPLPATHE